MCKASKAPLAHPQPPCRGARATLWQPLSLHCGPARHAPKPAAQGPKAQHKIGYIRFYRYIFVYRYTQTAGVEAPRASQQASCQAAGAHFGAGKRLQGPLQVCGRDVGGGLQLQVGQAVCVVEQHQDGHLVRADVELVLAPPKVRPQVCSTPRVSSVQALALLPPCHPCSDLTAWGRGWRVVQGSGLQPWPCSRRQAQARSAAQHDITSHNPDARFVQVPSPCPPMLRQRSRHTGIPHVGLPGELAPRVRAQVEGLELGAAGLHLAREGAHQRWVRWPGAGGQHLLK